MDFQQLGPYSIKQKIGRGGMGTVFAGVEKASGMEAAVKVLSIHLAQDEGFRERFEAEIETLRKLRHPNIVRLYGFGEQEGVLFYAMELVNGTSLEDELRKGRRFDWRETTRIGVQLCRALRHAHDRGVIHRDIKPANLLLVGDGPEIKLSDFGIAKLFGSTGLTADGGVIGTADYMAPEQADGRPVTHRADLYSVGGMLYALMAGRPPFQARSLPEMLHLQRYAEPELLRVHAPDAPAELEAIIHELLAKEPEQRIPNAQVLARRLEAMEHGLSRRASREAPDAAGDIHTSATAVGSPPADGSSPGSRGGEVPAAAPSDQDSASYRVADSAEPLDVTQAATQGEAADRIPAFWTSDAATVAASSAPPSDEASFVISPPARAAPATPPPAAKVAPAAPRFVTVDEEEDLDEESESVETGRLISAQTLVLIAAILSLGGITWYFLQPPSADALYRRVQAAAAEDRPERLVDVADDIKQFLNYYPEDRRGREVQRYLDEVELFRLDARYRRRGRLAAAGQDFTPLETVYADALRLVEIDPDRAARKLRAFIELYADDAELSAREQQCLKLAERQLQRLDTDDGNHTQELARIESRLAAAEAEPDRAAARRIYQGIVELYGDKPWAREAVDAAAARLLIGATAAPPSDPPSDPLTESPPEPSEASP